MKKIKIIDWANLIVTSLGVFTAFLALNFLRSQTEYVRDQTNSISEQTNILSQQFEASYRPYLSIENIETHQADNSSIKILITVKNYGQVPATKFRLQQVMIGGADVQYWTAPL
jgi:hypothetical protein